MTATPVKPQLYNRPWHLDLDNRRHQGARQWDRAALEQLIALIARFDFLYPPDWTDINVIRFRAPGAAFPFAELDTSPPDQIQVILTLPGPPTPRVAALSKELRASINHNSIALQLELPADLAHPLPELLAACALQFQSPSSFNPLAQ